MGMALIAVSCGDGSSAAEDAGGTVEVLDAGVVPETLLGLAVTSEELPETLADVQRSYLDGVRLFGIRDGELLVATLQVGRFRDGADVGSDSFRARLLQQIGGAQPRQARMGDDTVFLTTGVKQDLTVWFRDRHLFILGTRQEFDRPRSLLREALALDPGEAG